MFWIWCKDHQDVDLTFSKSEFACHSFPVYVLDLIYLVIPFHFMFCRWWTDFQDVELTFFPFRNLISSVIPFQFMFSIWCKDHQDVELTFPKSDFASQSFPVYVLDSISLVIPFQFMFGRCFTDDDDVELTFEIWFCLSFNICFKVFSSSKFFKTHSSKLFDFKMTIWNFCLCTSK